MAVDALRIEPDGEAAHGPCSDCGAQTRSVWGYVSNEAGARATYFVRWTDGHLERGAEMFVSMGRWDGASSGERVAFGIACRVLADGPAFMLVDAGATSWGSHEMLGAKLTRADALVHPTRPEVLAIVDRVIEDDPRVRGFLVG